MLTFCFQPFPELFTERFHLKQMSANDLDAFFEMRSDKETMQYIGRPVATSKEEVLKMISDMAAAIARNELIQWGIYFRGEQKLLGTVGYYRAKPEHHRAEIGYMLHPAWHKKGIMAEVIPAVINYGFAEMRLHSIEGVIDPRNKASENILLKNGFVKEAHFRENYFFEGKYLDSANYSLLTYFKD